MEITAKTGSISTKQHGYFSQVFCLMNNFYILFNSIAYFDEK